jgi:hypothetical protein
MDIPVSYSKKRLGILWFVCSGVLYFVMIFQSLLGHYENRVSDAWGWFLPTTLPTLSLMAAVFVADAMDPVAARKVDRFIYRLAFWTSFAYLAAVAITIFAQPFVAMPPVDLMKQSNLWMGPFQGIVSAVLGVFFVKRKG